MPPTPHFLADLRREIEAHPAANHIFLNRCATSPFSRQDYRVFAENHYPLACVLPGYVDRLLGHGNGSRGEDHGALYRRFLRAAGSAAFAPDARVPAPADHFLREHRRLVTREPFLVGLGAVGPTLAWAVPRMFEAVAPGLWRAGFSPDEICYFTRHVEEDGGRSASLEEALRRAGGAEAEAQIRRGALASLAAWGDFWTGVQSAVVRYRQPRALRPDGPRPRSLAHEIALTTWDGWPAAQRLEEAVRAVRERARPTLSRLLDEARR